MTRVGVMMLIAGVLGGSAAGARQAAVKDTDAVRLERAIDHELIDGDLPAVIEAYQSLSTSPDRAVAAKAALRLAAARAAIGGEQTGALPPRTVLTDSTDLNVEYPAISPDGHLLAYTDYVRASGNLMIRDLRTGLDRQITTDAKTPGVEVVEKSFSRDGRRLAYVINWVELRTIAVDSPGAAPALIFKPENARYVYPFDWSADGTRIAVQVDGKDNASRIGYVTLADRAFHPLRSLDWRGSSRLALSPDGAYLAYDMPSALDDQRDVYVVSTDGSREIAIAKNAGRDEVVAWSADGRQLLFASEKSGRLALWSQPMRGGRPNGAPAMLRADFTGGAVGLTATGDLFLYLKPPASAFALTAFDTRTFRAEMPSAKRIVALSAEWSRDSSSIEYLGTDRRTITIQDVGRGSSKQILVKGMAWVNRLRWAPDGQSFVGKGTNLENRAGFFRIDRASGDVASLALEPRMQINSPVDWLDPAHFSFISIKTDQPGRLPGIRETGANAPKLMEHSVATGEERELVALTSEPWATWGPSLSPDHHWLASRSAGPGEFVAGHYRDDPTSFVVLHDLRTGASKRIWTAPAFPMAFAGPIDWLPDSSALVVGKFVDPKVRRIELWLVPVNGEAPRKLEVPVQNLLPGSRLSPDGKHLLLLIGDNREREVQVLERVAAGAGR
jgi:Tol biopolymer transport system component